jgi:hypothetical protein
VSGPSARHYVNLLAIQGDERRIVRRPTAAVKSSPD